MNFHQRFSPSEALWFLKWCNPMQSKSFQTFVIQVCKKLNASWLKYKLSPRKNLLLLMWHLVETAFNSSREAGVPLWHFKYHVLVCTCVTCGSSCHWPHFTYVPHMWPSCQSRRMVCLRSHGMLWGTQQSASQQNRQSLSWTWCRMASNTNLFHTLHWKVNNVTVISSYSDTVTI